MNDERTVDENLFLIFLLFMFFVFLQRTAAGICRIGKWTMRGNIATTFTDRIQLVSELNSKSHFIKLEVLFVSSEFKTIVDNFIETKIRRTTVDYEIIRPVASNGAEI